MCFDIFSEGETFMLEVMFHCKFKRYTEALQPF